MNDEQLAAFHALADLGCTIKELLADVAMYPSPSHGNAGFLDQAIRQYTHSVEMHIMANVPIGVDPRYHCELVYETKPPHFSMVGDKDIPGTYYFRGEIPKVVIK